MFFILQVMLILLLNETFAYITEDTERILLPLWNSTSADEILLTLKTFGKQIQLNLLRNDQIVLSKFKENISLWKQDAKGITEELLQSNVSNTCYYFHKDHISTAIINFCQEHGWEGLVFLKDETLEIRPLHDFVSMLSIDDICLKEEINISFGKPHLIKRSLELSSDTSLHNLDNFKLKRRHAQNTQQKVTLELAVFFDQNAYRKFILFLDKNEEKLRLMILAYVNNIQALFHDPSLGVSIDITLVHLEIMREQPLVLKNFSGNANDLFNAFCSYAGVRNSADDNDPHHWDIGLYLTALDITSNKYIIGKSRQNGACYINHSCAMVEFGTSASKFDMTSGFTSSVIAAREIAHTLGLMDDSKNHNPFCEEGKYIMSPYQSYYGQLTWSVCSRTIARRLWSTKQCLRDPRKNIEIANDHLQYQNLPGREWTAKAQCEIFFRDKDANAITLIDICSSLKCERPNDSFHFTGPALTGTRCGLGKECRGGKCVSVLQPPLEYCDLENWSEWKEDPCQSSCLEHAKGVRVKRRFCKHGGRRTANCDGLYYDMSLCDDLELCISNQSRMKASAYAYFKCKAFNNILTKEPFNITEFAPVPGYQSSYSFEEPWKACTINCQQLVSALGWLPVQFSPYTPRLELLSIGMNPYMPDGTWCHKQFDQNYYCFSHECRPENKY